jgi:hypothetical protein
MNSETARQANLAKSFDDPDNLLLPVPESNRAPSKDQTSCGNPTPLGGLSR